MNAVFALTVAVSRTLTPTWEKLASSLADHPSLHVAKLDATEEISTAKRFDVRGFPTIKLVSRGRVFEHRGGRSVEALTTFAQESIARPAIEGAPVPDQPTTAQMAVESVGQRGNKQAFRCTARTCSVQVRS
jgi:thioredoxin-like negative regulator of GroEL